MDRLKSIVVGVDFSPGSAGAVRQAVRIAQWNSAELYAVHVVDKSRVIDLAATLDPFQKGIQHHIVPAALKTWSDFIAGIPEASGLELHVEIGHPLVRVLRRAQEHSADLLVLGTHGASGTRSGIGTLAAACVRKAMTKVLLLRDNRAGPFRSVVACIDFSETSRRALEQAARVAVQDRAELRILHVLDGPWNTLYYRTPTPRGTLDYEKQYRDALARRLEDFAAPLRDEMRDLQPQYDLFDFPGTARGIIEFVNMVGAGLVVLGTRGRANLRDILWGSTAERVVWDAPCSMLTVKPAGFEHPLALGRATTATSALERGATI